VVLIERGHEVGGGDHRFAVGTMAQVVEIEAPEGFVALLARGGQRFRVLDWLPDDPYPRADVELLPEWEWNEELAGLLARTEAQVREVLAVAGGDTWPADVALSEDPVSRSWQLAGLTPVGPLDHWRLLHSENCGQLLQSVGNMSAEVAQTLRMGWGQG
jgi:Lon protease-like protein